MTKMTFTAIMASILASFLLTSCAHYYGVGVGSTDVVNGNYKTTYTHRSFGIGLFVVPNTSIRQLGCGFMAANVTIYDPVAATIELQEWNLVKDVPKPVTNTLY